MSRKPRSEQKLTSQYRRGVRTPETLRAHAEDTTQWRRELARSTFRPHIQDRFLHLIREGASFKNAAEQVGLTVQFINGFAMWELAFAKRLHKAFRDAKPDVPHGTETGYRWGECRCFDCRLAHHPKTKTQTRLRLRKVAGGLRDGTTTT